MLAEAVVNMMVVDTRVIADKLFILITHLSRMKSRLKL
jgi:hypothetical protein